MLILTITKQTDIFIGIFLYISSARRHYSSRKHLETSTMEFTLSEYILTSAYSIQIPQKDLERNIGEDWLIITLVITFQWEFLFKNLFININILSNPTLGILGICQKYASFYRTNHVFQNRHEKKIPRN